MEVEEIDETIVTSGDEGSNCLALIKNKSGAVVGHTRFEANFSEPASQVTALSVQYLAADFDTNQPKRRAYLHTIDTLPLVCSVSIHSKGRNRTQAPSMVDVQYCTDSNACRDPLARPPPFHMESQQAMGTGIKFPHAQPGEASSQYNLIPRLAFLPAFRAKRQSTVCGAWFPCRCKRWSVICSRRC